MRKTWRCEAYKFTQLWNFRKKKFKHNESIRNSILVFPKLPPISPPALVIPWGEKWGGEGLVRVLCVAEARRYKKFSPKHCVVK